MNINSVQDPNEIQDPQISNLVDLLQTVKDEFGWNEIEVNFCLQAFYIFYPD